MLCLKYGIVNLFKIKSIHQLAPIFCHADRKFVTITIILFRYIVQNTVTLF